VFGNGIRFVWISDCSKHDEGAFRSGFARLEGDVFVGGLEAVDVLLQENQEFLAESAIGFRRLLSEDILFCLPILS
jgi:hypothetical protein